MSLLIKALDKAQDAKTKQGQAEKTDSKQKQEKSAQTGTTNSSIVLVEDELSLEMDSELSLSPKDEPLLSSPAPVSKKPQTTSSASLENSSNNTTASRAAANVFNAKRIEPSHQNTKLAIIAGTGLLALLAMGFYFYRALSQQPEVYVPPPVVQTSLPPSQPSANVLPPMEPVAPTQIEVTQPETEIVALDEADKPTVKPKPKTGPKLFDADQEIVEAESSAQMVSDNETAPTRKSTRTKKLDVDGIASKSASISVTRTKPQPSVNPLLISAYDAYNVGNDAEAQKLYKQVLQRDLRNVDALLGLGAIAERQGRIADAEGWYRRVLDVEPKNPIAQAALTKAESTGDVLTSESKLKNMLAKSPDDANLHAALGNFYAEQNQWPAAQQAYFDAYRLNTNADNAFNLAVSLDQMGKPKLALPYYQQALEQAQQSNSNIDKAALEARILAIQ